jgi:hypothetical protein
MPKRRILTAVLLSGCAAAAMATTAAASPDKAAPAKVRNAPAPDDQQPRERLELRAELYRAETRDQALPQARFRPLCDADGYPLVGNVASKLMRYEVGDYCADVRTKLAKGGS